MKSSKKKKKCAINQNEKLDKKKKGRYWNKKEKDLRTKVKERKPLDV